MARDRGRRKLFTCRLASLDAPAPGRVSGPRSSPSCTPRPCTPRPRPPPTPLWQLVEKAAEDVRVGEDFRTVAAHFRDLWSGSGPDHRLARVRVALARPWEVPALGAELRDTLAGTLASKRGARCEEAAQAAAAWLDVVSLPADDPELAALEAAWARVDDPKVEQGALLAALNNGPGAPSGASGNSGFPGSPREGRMPPTPKEGRFMLHRVIAAAAAPTLVAELAEGSR